MRVRLQRTAFPVALLVVAAAASAWWVGSAAPDPGVDLARLVPGHRPLEGRTTLAMPHAPFDAAAPKVGPGARDAIYGALLGARVDGLPGGASALAAFYAARNEPGDAERAVEIAEDPVDRGAVLLALGRPAEALEAVMAALAERPDDPAARFDRALALEALLLDGQAALAWEAFLELEATGGWADEARERLATLRLPPAPSERPLDLRKRDAVEQLLEARGAADLEPLRPVARLLSEAGDELLARELGYLESLDGEGWARRGVEVHRFLAARERVFAGNDAGPSLAALETSAEPLLAVKAVHFAAYGAIVRGDRDAGTAALSRLEELCRRIGCREELALVASDLGTLHQQAGDYRAAGVAFDRARGMLPTGFEGRASELLIKEASLLCVTGAPEEAEILYTESIRLARKAGMAHAIAPALTFRAVALRSRGENASAEACLREAIDAARIHPDRGDRIAAVVWLSDLLAETGRAFLGQELLEEAIGQLRGPNLERQLSDCLVELSRIKLGSGDLHGAMATAAESVHLARTRSSRLSLTEALEALAMAAWASGDRDLALRSIEEAVWHDEQRIARTQGIFPARRLATDVASRRMRWAQYLVEEDAILVAYQAFAGGVALPPPAPDECRIGFAIVGNRLLTFSHSATGVGFDSRILDPRGLELLEGPVSPEADLMIGSPWARDRCPQTARRVVFLEPPGAVDYPVTVPARRERPDAIMGVALAPNARWPGSPRRGSGLAVYSPTVGDGLPSLPGGVKEADAIAESWGSIERLFGAEASIEVLQARVGGADLIHFAVHGVAGDRSAASYLLLAGQEGRLQVSDVLALDLQARNPLVVLSSCSSADASDNLEDDGGGLPWAFLAAGARAVIAHVGKLGDEDAVRFSRTLYRELSAGLPLEEAVAVSSREIPLDTNGGFVLYFR